MDLANISLGGVANIAAILTAVIAVFGYVLYRVERYSKRRKVENYLKHRKEAAASDGKKGQHSVLHLMAQLGLSESEVYQASFGSKHIQPVLTKGALDGMAKDILFEYRA